MGIPEEAGVNWHRADRATLEQKLLELKIEHRDLDDVIRRLEETPPQDELQLRRLKKRKLLLRDEIAWIERKLVPNQPA